MRVIDLVEAMEALAPTHRAAPWDNVGLLVGDPAQEIAAVLLTIDCTAEVLEEAAQSGCSAVVAYHPPIFAAQKRFVAPSIAHDAARAHIAIYSPHTALDAVDGGTNDTLADTLGMTGRAPLAFPSGFGRVGAVAGPSAREMVARVKRALGVTHVLVAGGLSRSVTRAAVCAGSGGDFIDDAVRSGAQLLLTGELRHHDALRAVAAGITAVCTLHSASERATLKWLEAKLADKLPGVVIARSECDREPLVVA